jgi:hypothetical protein
LTIFVFCEELNFGIHLLTGLQCRPYRSILTMKIIGVIYVYYTCYLIVVCCKFSMENIFQASVVKRDKDVKFY